MYPNIANSCYNIAIETKHHKWKSQASHSAQRRFLGYLGQELVKEIWGRWAKNSLMPFLGHSLYSRNEFKQNNLTISSQSTVQITPKYLIFLAQ